MAIEPITATAVSAIANNNLLLSINVNKKKEIKMALNNKPIKKTLDKTGFLEFIKSWIRILEISYQQEY